MSLGFDRNSDIVNLGDAAQLYPVLTDVNDTPIEDADLISVQFIIQKPDGSSVELVGEIQDDGRGFLVFKETDQVGAYLCVAKFKTLDFGIRSVRYDFEVIDPFDPPVPTDADIIIGKVWDKLEDCFDSEMGGPWLRDVTMDFFSKDKVVEFIDEGLLDINLYHPPTDLMMEDFMAQRADGTFQNLPLLTEAVFLAVVRHLMRSYTEQPLPVGAQIVYEDRRDYQQRWKAIYDLEFQLFEHWAKLFKRQFLGLGKSKLLISNKAGRLLPAPMRTRFSGRGWI